MIWGKVYLAGECLLKCFFLVCLRLGKTVTTIAFLQLRMNSIKQQDSSEEIFHSSKPRSIPTTLVVCPATLMSHWENEITKFSRMRCFIYHGSSRKKDIPVGGAIRAFGQYCVVLTSYELVRAEHTSEETKVNNFILITVIYEITAWPFQRGKNSLSSVLYIASVVI